jgi:hypothetical protein
MDRTQRNYDDFVSRVGCQNTTDSLQCLREAPYEALKAAMDASSSIFSKQVSTQLVTNITAHAEIPCGSL